MINDLLISHYLTWQSLTNQHSCLPRQQSLGQFPNKVHKSPRIRTSYTGNVDFCEVLPRGHKGFQD